MFSEELMDIFRIDNSVADLDEKVDKRSVACKCPASPLQDALANCDKLSLPSCSYEANREPIPQPLQLQSGFC